MSVIHNKYSLYCNTESATVYTDFKDTAPTVCPNNNAHTITPSTITVVDSFDENVRYIKTPHGTTNGYWKINATNVNVTTETNQVFDLTSPPYVVSSLLLTFITDDNNVGDVVTLNVSPNTTIGVLTGTGSTGDSVLHVSPTVIAYINRGFIVNVTNGVTGESLGACVLVNGASGTISVETPLTQSWNPGTTFVQFTLEVIKGYSFMNAGNHVFGQKSLNSRDFPANTPVKLYYTNNSGTTKKLQILNEVFY